MTGSINQNTTAMPYYVYILTNKTNKPKGVFYVGVTNNLQKRVFEHKQEMAIGFTKKYKVKNLAYYEIYDDVRDAISREKLVKKWRRSIKIEAIERINPEWKDLYFEL